MTKVSIFNESTKSISTLISEFAINLDFNDIPTSVINRAKLHILDALGIAFASSSKDYSVKTLDALMNLAGEGSFPVIGFSQSLPFREAAIMNGFLIHSLDYDDTHVAGVIHGTASTIPAVIASAQKYDCDGRSALTAYIAGIEASSRIGMAAKGGFHKKGFHPTGLVGAFGSTVSAGVILGLSELELIHAQGSVYSMASGNLEFLEEGAWTKRLHPGWAASCGITASTLALHGFQGPLLPYEGRFGLFANCADRELLDIKLATAGLGETWEMMSVAIKPYPACHLTHSCIDAARYLSNTHQLSSENISKIIVRVASDSMPVVCEPLEEKRRPKSGYEAQFSLPYLVASAICRDRLALIDLEKEAYTDPVVINLCQRINCEPMDGSLYPAYFSGEVEVLTNDGESFIRREIINRGSDKTPITDAEIKKKYMENSKLALPSDMAEEIMGVVLNLDNCKSFNSLSSLLGKNINSNYITT